MNIDVFMEQLHDKITVLRTTPISNSESYKIDYMPNCEKSLNTGMGNEFELPPFIAL